MRKEYSIHIFDLNVALSSFLGTGVDFVASEPIEINKADMPFIDLGSKVSYENIATTQLEKLMEERNEKRPLEELYVRFDFSSFPIQDFNKKSQRRSKTYLALKKIFDDGITLFIHDVPTTYLPFEKSGSMGKDSQMVFVEKSYCKPLRNRIMFDLPYEGKEFDLSRLFAYNGLAISDGYPIPNPPFGLNEESVVIVRDLSSVVRGKFTIAFNYQTLTANAVVPDSPNLYSLHHLFLLKKENDPALTNVMEGYGFHKANEKEVEIVSEQLLNDVSKALESYFPEENRLDEVRHFLRGYLEDHLHDFDPKKAFSDFEEAYQIKPRYSLHPENDHFRLLKARSVAKEVKWFDGEGFISNEFADYINENYSKKKKGQGRNHTSFQIRMPYMKGMVHRCDFKKFYEEHKDLFSKGGLKDSPFIDENGKLFLIDAYGIPRDISKIELLLTAGQFKGKWFASYVKENHPDVMAYYFKKFNEYGHQLFIANSNPIRNPNNALTNLNYQLIGTSGMSKEELFSLADNKNNLGLYGRMFYDPEAMALGVRKIRITKRESKDEENDTPSQLVDDYLIREETLAKAVAKSDLMLHEPAVKEGIQNCRKTMAEDIALGRLNVEGESRYLSSDLLLLLYSTLFFPKPEAFSEEFIGKTLRRISLRTGEVYAPEVRDKANPGIHLEPGETAALLRNPHIVNNEDVLLNQFKGKENNERERYFSHLDGLVMVNPTSLVPDRLGGADFDGDIVQLIKEPVVVESLKRTFTQVDGGFWQFRTRVVLIPSPKAKPKEYNAENTIDVLTNTFANKVGLYSNKGFAYADASYNRPIDAKTKQRLASMAQFYLITVGLEIDSVKNGVKPADPEKTSLTKLESTNYFLEYKKDGEAKEDITLPDDSSPLENLPYYVNEKKGEIRKESRKEDTDNDSPYLSFMKPYEGVRKFRKFYREIHKEAESNADWKKLAAYLLVYHFIHGKIGRIRHAEQVQGVDRSNAATLIRVIMALRHNGDNDPEAENLLNAFMRAEVEPRTLVKALESISNEVAYLKNMSDEFDSDLLLQANPSDRVLNALKDPSYTGFRLYPTLVYSSAIRKAARIENEKQLDESLLTSLESDLAKDFHLKKDDLLPYAKDFMKDYPYAASGSHGDERYKNYLAKLLMTLREKINHLSFGKLDNKEALYGICLVYGLHNIPWSVYPEEYLSAVLEEKGGDENAE